MLRVPPSASPDLLIPAPAPRHDAPVTALHFFPGEPRLMSAGGDNAMKQWVLDSADGSARLLRFRSVRENSPHPYTLNP